MLNEEYWDSEKNTYREGQLIFPFIFAEPADNTSKISVDYDFKNLKAEITVKSPKGMERKVKIKYNNNMSNIHFVTGAIDETTDFVADSGSNPDSEGKQGLISKNNVGTLTYMLDGVSKSQQYKLYNIDIMGRDNCRRTVM